MDGLKWHPNYIMEKCKFKILLTREDGAQYEHFEECEAREYCADWVPFLENKYKEMYPNCQIDVISQNKF